MARSNCPVCGNRYSWKWEAAFDKFGYGDGDGDVQTGTVAAALRRAGYAVDHQPWGLHNDIVESIKKDGVELIPESARVGYDDPRSYLPAAVVKLLDQKLGDHVDLECDDDEDAS